MSSSTDWDKRFLDLAFYVSKWSKDRGSQVGSVIVLPDRQPIFGYNGFVRGANDEIEERHDRKSGEKYYWSVHAEENAILNCALLGISPKGSSIYSTHPPCMKCANAIVQVGIVRVVAPEPDYDDDDKFHQRWAHHIMRMEMLFQESEVDLHYVKSTRNPYMGHP